MKSARHQGLNDRIRLAAAERNSDPQRLRRAVVFHRLLARLAPHGFVLKGGFCLEARLPGVARATKDLDLVGNVGAVSSQDELLDWLEPMLTDLDSHDGFSFECPGVHTLRVDTPWPAWRLKVIAMVDGAPFESVIVDVVGQFSETEGGVETITLASPLSVPGFHPVDVLAVDVYQHAAEKLHAYSRIYAGDRPSSRVKDLVDVVLLVEAGLLDNPRRLRHRLQVVWIMRDQSAPPATLPAPPRAWEPDFAAYAAQLRLTTVTVGGAYRLIADLYAIAIQEGPSE